MYKAQLMKWLASAYAWLVTTAGLVARFFADLGKILIAPVHGTEHDKIKTRDTAASAIATTTIVGWAAGLFELVNLVSGWLTSHPDLIPASYSTAILWGLGSASLVLQFILRFKQGPPA